MPTTRAAMTGGGPLQASLIARRRTAAAASSSPAASTGLNASGDASAAVPTVLALLPARMDHAESLLKDACANITAVDDKQKALEERGVGSWMHGDVVHDTVEYVTTSTDAADVLKTVDTSQVVSGTTVSLCYPMVEGGIDDDVVFLMQRRFVDPDTAEIGASWVVVFRADGGSETHHVKNFRF